MKLYNKTLWAIGASLAIIASGCSESDEWTPGPQDTETGAEAYFIKPDKSSYVFDSQGDADSMSIDITVKRNNTQSDASVNLIFSTDCEGFSFPASANFAKGEDSATISIGCGGIPSGKKQTLTISLPENQTNIYGTGLFELTLDIIKAEWIEIADNVRYLYSDYNYNPIYPTTYAHLYHLEGTHTFKFSDFFGSGLDMTFDCDTPDYTPFLPLSNWDPYSNYFDGDQYECWYLYDEENQTWPQWIPGDAEGYLPIDYLMFYGTGYSNITMIYTPSSLYGYAAFSVDVTQDNGNVVGGAFQADFNLKYNPFE